MDENDKQKRTNDSLQSSEIDPALGQDERSFGAGGQTAQRPLSGDDTSDRETGRDPTVPGRKPEAAESRR